MNILDLTLRQLQEIKNSYFSQTDTPLNKVTQYDPFSGKPVLVRHNLHGVNCGVLSNQTKEGFYLNGGRKFWRWQADKGVSLESFAKAQRSNGTRASHVQESVFIPSEGLCGIILLSDSEFKSMLEIEVSEQD